MTLSAWENERLDEGLDTESWFWMKLNRHLIGYSPMKLLAHLDQNIPFPPSLQGQARVSWGGPNDWHFEGSISYMWSLFELSPAFGYNWIFSENNTHYIKSLKFNNRDISIPEYTSICFDRRLAVLIEIDFHLLKNKTKYDRANKPNFLNHMEFHSVLKERKHCQHDYIPFTF